SWGGDEIQFVTAGRSRQCKSVQEIFALDVLSAESQRPGACAQTAYAMVRFRYNEIGPMLGDLIAKHLELQELCFTYMTHKRGALPSTLTSEINTLLYGVRGPMGEDFLEKYSAWLTRFASGA